MTDKLANCPYCGQGVMIKAEKGWSEDQILKEAIMNCNCEEARHQQEIQQSVYEAEMYLKNVFPAPELIRYLFLNCCEDIGQGRFQKISVCADKSKYTMTKTSKGSIKIEKVTTVKEAKEN